MQRTIFLITIFFSGILGSAGWTNDFVLKCGVDYFRYDKSSRGISSIQTRDGLDWEPFCPDGLEVKDTGALCIRNLEVTDYIERKDIIITKEHIEAVKIHITENYTKCRESRSKWMVLDSLEFILFGMDECPGLRKFTPSSHKIRSRVPKDPSEFFPYSEIEEHWELTTPEAYLSHVLPIAGVLHHYEENIMTSIEVTDIIDFLSLKYVKHTSPEYVITANCEKLRF